MMSGPAQGIKLWADVLAGRGVKDFYVVYRRLYSALWRLVLLAGPHLFIVGFCVLFFHFSVAIGAVVILSGCVGLGFTADRRSGYLYKS
jgi:hypothetical protein